MRGQRIHIQLLEFWIANIGKKRLVIFYRRQSQVCTKREGILKCFYAKRVVRSSAQPFQTPIETIIIKRLHSCKRFQNVISPYFVRIVWISERPCKAASRLCRQYRRNTFERCSEKAKTNRVNHKRYRFAERRKRGKQNVRRTFGYGTRRSTKRTPRKNNRNFAILTNPINAAPPPPRSGRATSDGVYYETRVICRAARFLSPVYYIVVEKKCFFRREKRGKIKTTRVSSHALWPPIVP